MPYPFLLLLASATFLAGYALTGLPRLTHRWLRLLLVEAMFAIALLAFYNISSPGVLLALDLPSPRLSAPITALIIAILAWYRPWTAPLAAAGAIVTGILLAAGGHGPDPIHGWGLIWLPTFLAGLLFGRTAARQFVLQLTLLSGWLLLFYTPATQTLLNWLDEYGWRKSYALTSLIPAHQAELAIRAAERNQIVAVVAYLLLLLPTLGLAWLPAIAFLTDSLHQKPSPDPLGNA